MVDMCRKHSWIALRKHEFPWAFRHSELKLKLEAAHEPYKHCEYHGFPYVHVDPLAQLVGPE